MSKCFAFGLAAYRAGLGIVAGRIVPIVSECVSVGLTADGAVCGVGAVSSATDTLVVNRQATFITFAVKGIGIIATLVCDLAAAVITKVITVGAVGVGAHIGLTASVVTNMILRCYVGMSECIAFGLAAYRTSLGSVAGRIVPIVSECFNENLAAFGTNLIGRTACRRTARVVGHRDSEIFGINAIVCRVGRNEYRR